MTTPVRTDGARCGASKTHPPPIGARPTFERPPGAPRGLLMAVTKWASTGLGWGGGLSRLRTRSAARWDGDSTPKLPLGGIQHCQPASSSSSGLYYRPYCAASYWQPGGRAPRAPRRAHGSQSSNEYCRPAASRLPGGSTRLAMRAPAALAAAPAAAALAAAAPAAAGGTAAGGRCTRAFPRGRRRAARAQLCWHTARVVTQPRRTGGAVREARAISYF